MSQTNNQETFNYDNGEFPFLAYMISQHPDDVKQVPVMGFFFGPQSFLELNIDEIINALDPDTNEENFKPRFVGRISEVNKRDILMKIIPEKGILLFYLGFENKPVTDKNSIEKELEIGLIDASIALNDYLLRTEQWMDEAMSEIDER